MVTQCAKEQIPLAHTQKYPADSRSLIALREKQQKLDSRVKSEVAGEGSCASMKNSLDLAAGNLSVT